MPDNKKMVWTDEYKVHSYEAGRNGYATMPALCNFMQETAWNHAEHLNVGFSHLLKKNLSWVLSRLHVAIAVYPKWGDVISLHTWPTGMDRLFCYRDFRITDRENRVLGVATSTWFVIDITSRRPQRTETYIDLQVQDVEKAFPQFAEKLRPVDFSETERQSIIRAAYHDLDVNEHVNNVKYIESLYEGLSSKFLTSHHLTDLEINFLSEALYDDKIAVYSRATGDATYQHSLKSDERDQEFCRARTRWRVCA